MSEWTEESLGRLASIEIGGTPSRDIPAFWASENGEGFPWVSIADLGPRFVSATKERITELGVLLSNVKPVRSGTLMMSFKLTIGRAGIAARDLYTNEAIAAFVPMPRTVDSGFLYYLLPPVARNAVTDVAIKGSTLNKQTLSKLKLRFPKDMQQQRRIAEILSTLDEAIEQTEALIAKHQQIKAGLMHDLFTRGVTPDGHLRPTRKQAPDLYKESLLGWIPKEWEVISIADAFEIQLGKMLNKLAKTGKWTAPYLGNRAVQWDFVDCMAIEEMDFTTAERQKFSLECGDLLVCEGGDVGRTAMWRGEIEGCYYQKAIHRLRPKSERALPAFMLRFMRFARESGYFREFTSQSSIAHLTQEKLGVMPMLLPKPEEQNRIAERFDAHDELIQSEQTKLTKLRQQKHGLMHDLLTGRVRVPPAKIMEDSTMAYAPSDLELNT